MSLNDIIARLQADTGKPKLPDVALYVPADTPLDLWHLYRAIWQIQKCLKCSRCTEAHEGRCKRGEERKAAHKADRPCFRPTPKLLLETEAIVNQCLTTLTALTAK